MNCRLCGSTDLRPFVDLGHQPPSNSFLTIAQLDEPEVTYPLKLFTCAQCRLVQIPEYKMAREIFTGDYPYYSSESPSNVQHAKKYVKMITERFKPERVLEIGGNDGYLLQHFPKTVDVINVEPSSGPADKSIEKGIPTICSFFTKFFASRNELQFDLICGINVLAHQPDLNDFVEGIAIALKSYGVCTMEFPHLYHLIDQCQFDTIYHEHYSYFSLSTILKLFGKHNLQVFDVEELPEHGGSLRIYAHKIASGTSGRVQDVLNKERKAGMMDVEFYSGFQAKVDRVKRDLVRFIMDIPEDYTIAAYGAAAKGNTLLNYCGIKSDLIPVVADRSPHKQGKYLPGSHIQVISPEELDDFSPDYVLVLPWNIKREIMKQLDYIREYDGKFVIPIPTLEVV